MTKKDLIAKVAEETGLSASQAKAAFEAICGTIVDTLVADKGETVKLDGIGTLKVSLRSAKTCRNPRTGETVDVPEQYKCVLRSTNKMEIFTKLNG